MERTKLLTGAVTGLFLLNLVTISSLILRPGRPGRSGSRDPKGEPAQVIIERLHFDDQQEKQYRQLIGEHQNQTRSLNNKSQQLYRQYYGLLASDQPDTAKEGLLVGQIAQTQRTLAQLNFSHFKQIKALCKPDQQADFTRLVSDLAQLFGRQQRPRRPGGPEGPLEGRPGGPPEGEPENIPPRP